MSWHDILMGVLIYVGIGLCFAALVFWLFTHGNNSSGDEGFAALFIIVTSPIAWPAWLVFFAKEAVEDHVERRKWERMKREDEQRKASKS
jgi:multisubunit Na+/H+ antiporter MnhG subunit